MSADKDPNLQHKTLYAKEDIEQAKRAMLDSLARISGGKLIPGCCTQGCCEADAQSVIVLAAEGKRPAAKKRYTREDIDLSKQALMSALAALSGGRLLDGCCTQGCCDPTAQNWLVDPAP